MSRPRMIVIGYARQGFGFGRVVGALAPPLSRSMDVRVFDRNRVTSRERSKPGPRISNDRYRKNELEELISSFRPDLVFLVGELEDVATYAEICRSHPSAPRFAAYCAVEGALTDPAILSPLASVDHLVLYTEFGRRQVIEGARRLVASAPEFALPPMSVVPHGIHTDVFAPISSLYGEHRRRARAALWGAGSDLEDAFIVFNGNRNQMRKRIDLTLEGFREFAADKPDNVKLYLHMGSMDRGQNLLGLARRLGLEGRLLWTCSGRDHPVVSDRRLNLIYNACDVGINTACAEGWGLVSFEHAATLAAQVVPDAGVFPEIWDRSAVFLKTETSDSARLPVVPRTVLPGQVAGALQNLYDNPRRCRDYSDAAFLRATRPEYRWSHIAARFEGILHGVVSSEPWRRSGSDAAQYQDSCRRDRQSILCG